MKAWKFILPFDNQVAIREDSGLDAIYQGCFAAVFAVSEEAARARVQEYAAKLGFDARWLAVAEVRFAEIVDGEVIAFIMA